MLFVTAQHTFTACLTGNVLLHWRSLNPGREMSPVGNCPGREMSGRDLSRSGNVQSGNVRSGNVEIGKCRSGNVGREMSNREMYVPRSKQVVRYREGRLPNFGTHVLFSKPSVFPR